MTSKQIRQQFVDYFLSKGHVFVESSPVVPHDDPTLMFTNAGMNQFKPIFLGTERAKSPRVANSQKCIRAGGKHNDLDDVGQDTYHHTFFEMLGNWSFGDYFKKEAIEWAWELLTKVWGIDKSRLHATYFQGDPAEGLEPDSEAAELWRTATDINPKHIHPGNKKDNFWEMGETGPCGPCSEVHIDLTPDKSGASLVNKGDARVMEIWNLVFIQFNRAGDGKLTPLPAKHVDTGMGFERLCSVLQGMERNRLGRFSNYDTDVFTPIFDAIRKRTNAPEYRGTLPSDTPTPPLTKGGQGGVESQIMVDVSYRVIGDHIRCLTFALTDGATPSNEGRGYVLRRILRRAVRYGRQYLNMHEPFLCDLVEPLINHMAEAFPELRTAHRGKNTEHVRDLIRDEEASFLKTLDRGIKLFAEAADYATSHHHGKISGEDAFKLHDTYGFPIDLTELMAEEHGLTIDVGEYERLMEAAKALARGGTGLKELAGLWEGLFVTDEARPRAKASASIGAFRKGSAPTIFLGYDRLDVFPTCVVELRSQSADDNELAEGERGALVLDSTPFYAEQGGQVGDTGTIFAPFGGWRFRVTDTKKVGGAHVHIGLCENGRIQVMPPGADDRPFAAQAIVDQSKRHPTMQNHTSTHILNWALREVLEIGGGGKVDQKGSLVDPEKTRFDFSHNKPLTDEELVRIEELCNQQVAAGLRVYSKEVDQKKAREINTLRAVFGEKYPDVVRVVSVGADIDEMLRDPSNAKWMKYSVEFCGGTHVANTSEIGRFVLTHEEGVAKGVRRVIGISGEKAKKAIAEGESLLGEAKRMVGASGRSTPPLVRGGAGGGESDLAAWAAGFQTRLADAEIPLRTRREIQAVLADVQKIVKEREKQAASASGGAVMDRVAALFAEATTIGGVTVVVGEVPSAPIDALRGAIDWVRNKTSAAAGSAALLASVSDGKVTLMAGMSKAVVDRGVKAGDLIKEISPLVGGKGGGRPDMAQGGGTDVSGVSKAIDAGKKWISQRLSAK